MAENLKNKAKKAPDSPGVYQFKDESGVVLYVGKAKNLKNRLNSYFSNQLMEKTRQMLANASKVTYIKVNSEFEALLLEANLVKKYAPKYNIELKDDKSPLYIGITKEKYPRIVTYRKTDIKKYKLKIYFGPYLSGLQARQLLRNIRRVFNFSTHEPMKRICIYKQIGLCNPCPSEIENETDPNKKLILRKKYLRNVMGVRNILNGKLSFVEKDIEKQIKELSKSEEFEEAQKVNTQLNAFRNLMVNNEDTILPYLENPNFLEDIRNNEWNELCNILQKNGITNLRQGYGWRVECFDIAHLAGSFPTASMVTFINGEADKNYYRHFKIYQNKSNSDVDSMKEVIKRRLKHLEDWGRPDLIIIDGGKPQLSKVGDLLSQASLPGGPIPYIGLAKRYETIVIRQENEFVEIRPRGEALKLLQRIRDEAHRFARRLHHKQVSKAMIK